MKILLANNSDIVEDGTGAMMETGKIEREKVAVNYADIKEDMRGK